MEIYLIRHGQSTGNGRQCFLGWSYHPLSALGEAQAIATAARMAPLGPMPVLCSDLPRACQTAEAIAAIWHGLVTPDPCWREVGCGEYEGRPWDDFSRNAELTRQFDLDPVNTPMPGGESVAQMAARVCTAFSEVCQWTEERIAIVAHDGPIRAVLAHCLQIPVERFWTLATDHGGASMLAITDDWLSARTINDTSHLREVT